MPRSEGWTRWKRDLGVPYHFVMHMLERVYLPKAKPPPMAPDLRRALVQDFRGEISKLSELTGRDLSGWCGED
jgi:hypothetical protein